MRSHKPFFRKLSEYDWERIDDIADDAFQQYLESVISSQTFKDLNPSQELMWTWKKQFFRYATYYYLKRSTELPMFHTVSYNVSQNS